MLTKGDEYPLHQTPEPMAYSGSDRNFYDRYFFNGYSPDGSIFFAAAMGIYPQLDIMDASFCLLIDGVQHNIRASKHMGSERLDMQVGPIRIEIIEPLEKLRLVVADNDSGITADLTLDVRHKPIEEPRFTRRQGARMQMDVTRLTQNVAWSGTISHDGTDHAITPDAHRGTRDRSWGIRAIGAPESQPPPMGSFPQFYWLWTPSNFDDHAAFFHTNDDGEGETWNRRGVVDAIGSETREYDAVRYDVAYKTGTRRVETLKVALSDTASLHLEPFGVDFYMSGLGYMHPEWGHGMDHGEQAVTHDTIDTREASGQDQLYIHIQALAKATLTIDGAEYHGVSAVEQLLIGPHAPSGFTAILDPAS